MTIFLSGGSNTLKEKGGWVSSFRDLADYGEPIENVSIGAAPSYMGAFRVMRTIDLKKGDTVLWEYGINDANHIDQRGYDDGQLVEAVEWYILHCAEVEAKFCALIFQSREREQLGELTPYRKKLRDLFDGYSIPFFDVSTEFVRRRPKHNRLPDRLYRNNAHYKLAPGISNFIAKGACGVVDAAIVPKKSNSERSKPVFYDEFQGAEPEVFENSLLKMQVWSPVKGGIMQRFDGDGEVVGLVITSTPDGGALNFSIGDVSHRISAAFHEKKFNKTMLKFISIPTLAGTEIKFKAGEQFTIKFSDSDDGMLADLKFKRKLSDESLRQREARIVALITRQVCVRRQSFWRQWFRKLR